MILCNFRSRRPKYLIEQNDTLSWLALAHARAESMKNPDCEQPASKFASSDLIARLLKRYGCSSEQIAARGTEIFDFTHTAWEKMDLFHPNSGPFGPTMTQRSEQFKVVAKRIGEELFPAETVAPDHIIHVTCTGYISPSCTQEIVTKNGWQQKTVVTHAYHMGCHASLPAVRMAEGFLASVRSENASPNPDFRADIFHTEMCSLHVQLHDHSPEQLVVQSLFADGFIVYSAVHSDAVRMVNHSGLEVETLHEEIIPDTAGAITWDCSEWGMRMGLSSIVPEAISANLVDYMQRLCLRCGISLDEICKKAVFAVHPGGPRIIDRIQAVLGLRDDQLKASRHILKSCGNMSSATLPHVWENICADSAVSAGTRIVSLAFGPGLCISGALMSKIGKS
ncbi:MAG: 3-oxoacyl-[acyl-carrier-protein] synthase III C-terminal domain-containing protein [Candidatus Rifleibacteriota bacterium]